MIRIAGQSDLHLSLVLLASPVALALVSLAFDANWPKVLRVSSAFAAYVLVLLAAKDNHLGVMRFMLAGAVAGLVSGLVRPDPLPLLTIAVQMAGGGLLLGPLHWLALRWQQRLRSRIVA